MKFSVDVSEFRDALKGTFFRPNVDIINTGVACTIFNAQLTSTDTGIYDQINETNPYNKDRDLWSQPKTYDFTSGSVSRDWGIALTGNPMLSPGKPVTDFAQQTSEGIQLKSVRDNAQYSNGGIESTQLLRGELDFHTSMKFTAKTDDTKNPYEPTFGFWTYGEAQGGGR